ncbi:hypothetical protein [Cohnella xylanilytica]|uniref:hypothetical protein n=1 Tax=Cohnella xylanilytica TaxID=557555 RepID=UPI00289301E9|nr:hypothetical protein [Cohnella xylanilytica]
MQAPGVTYTYPLSYTYVDTNPATTSVTYSVQASYTFSGTTSGESVTSSVNNINVINLG